MMQETAATSDHDYSIAVWLRKAMRWLSGDHEDRFQSHRHDLVYESTQSVAFKSVFPRTIGSVAVAPRLLPSGFNN